MSECDFMRDGMPLLLTESLDPVRRELTHRLRQRLERCVPAEEGDPPAVLA